MLLKKATVPMEQMNISPKKEIILDFEDWPITPAAQKLKPCVFLDGSYYTCLLGPDREKGILGKGTSPFDAVLDWENQLYNRLATAGKDDEVAIYASNVLNFNGRE